MPRPRPQPYEVLERVQSSTRSTTFYQIRRGGDGVIYCTCPGWRFRGTCSHLQEYLSRHPQAQNRPEPLPPGYMEAAHTAPPEPRPANTYTAASRYAASIQGPKRWQVYNHGKLVGTVEAQSSDDVLARFKICKGAKDEITVSLLRDRR